MANNKKSFTQQQIEKEAQKKTASKQPSTTSYSQNTSSTKGSSSSSSGSAKSYKGMTQEKYNQLRKKGYTQKQIEAAYLSKAPEMTQDLYNRLRRQGYTQKQIEKGQYDREFMIPWQTQETAGKDLGSWGQDINDFNNWSNKNTGDISKWDTTMATAWADKFNKNAARAKNYMQQLSAAGLSMDTDEYKAYKEYFNYFSKAARDINKSSDAYYSYRDQYMYDDGFGQYLSYDQVKNKEQQLRAEAETTKNTPKNVINTAMGAFIDPKSIQAEKDAQEKLNKADTYSKWLAGQDEIKAQTNWQIRNLGLGQDSEQVYQSYATKMEQAEAKKAALENERPDINKYAISDELGNVYDYDQKGYSLVNDEWYRKYNKFMQDEYYPAKQNLEYASQVRDYSAIKNANSDSPEARAVIDRGRQVAVDLSMDHDAYVESHRSDPGDNAMGGNFEASANYYRENASKRKILDPANCTEAQYNTWLWYLGSENQESADRFAKLTNDAYTKQKQYEKYLKPIDEFQMGLRDDKGNLVLDKNGDPVYEGHPVLGGIAATAAGIVVPLFTGIPEYISMADEYFATGEITNRDLMPSKITSRAVGNTARQLNEWKGTIDDDLAVVGGKGLGDLYQVTLSAAQSYLSIAMTGGTMEALTLAQFFGSAASSTIYEKLDDGMDPEKALTLGTWAGIAEVLGEKVSVENLIKIGNSKAGRNMLTDILLQAGIEGSEEAFTTIMNTMGDEVISRLHEDESAIQIAINSYISQGMNHREAEKQAIKDWLNGIGEDALGGFISGAMGATGQNVRANIGTYGGQTEYLMDLASQTAEGSRSRDMLPKIQEQYENAQNRKRPERRNISKFRGNQFAAQVQEDLVSNNTDTAVRAIEQRLTELGETGDVHAKAQTIANAVISDMAGEEAGGWGLTPSDQYLAGKGTTNMRTVMDELAQAREQYVDYGRPNSEWTDPIVKGRFLDQKVLSRNLGATIKYAQGREAQKNLEEHTSQIADLEQSIPELQQEIQEYRKEIGKLNSKDANTPARRAELQSKIAETRQKITEAEKALKGHQAAILQDGYNSYTAKEKAASVKVDGKEYNVSGLTMKGGNTQVELTDSEGNTMNVSMDDDRLPAPIRSLAIKANSLGWAASAAFKYYKPGTNVSEFISQVQNAKAFASEKINREAFMNLDAVKALDSMPMAEFLYSHGQDLYNARQAAVEKARTIKNKIVQAAMEKTGDIDNVRTKGKGKVDTTSGWTFSDGKHFEGIQGKKLTKTQNSIVKMVNLLADALNIDYVIYDGDAKGVLGVSQEAGVIAININAGMNVKRALAAETLSHELTHFQENFAPEEYEALRAAVVDAAYNKNAALFEKRVLAQMRLLPDTIKGDQERYDAAVREVVADACTTMLRDSKVVTELARENMTLAEKVADFIEQTVNSIKQAIAEAYADSDPKYRRQEVSLIEDRLEEIQKLWDEGLRAATFNYNALQTTKGETDLNSFNAKQFMNEKTTGDGGEQFSIANTRDMSWEEQMNAYFGSGNNSLKSSDSLYIDVSEDFIDGVTASPRYIPTSVITKAMRAQKGSRSAHTMTEGDIRNLQEGIKQAAAVIYNPSRNAIVYIAQEAQNGGHVVAAFDLNNNLFGENAHKATSIHPRDSVVPMLENLGKDATIYVLNENKFNDLTGLQSDNPPELLAKIELVDRTIPQSTTESKTQDQMQTWDGVEETAKEHFGTTDNYRTAGYILQDGTMLDFSGAHWLEGYDEKYIADWRSKNDIRQVDHEDIFEAFEQSFDDFPSDSRKAFIDRGNIRFSPEAPGINISNQTKLTSAQYQRIKDFIRSSNIDRFYVDIEGKKGRIGKLEYSGKINADRVVNDIRSFYMTGEVRQSSVSQFHDQYQLTDTAPDEIHKAVTDKNYKGDINLTKNSPSIILGHKGVRDLPMFMKASHIRENILTEAEARAMGLKVDEHTHYHGLGETLFNEVIKDLDSVKEAYRGTKNADKAERGENYFLLISQHKDSTGNTIQVPVYINEHRLFNRVFIDTNIIASAFGKEGIREYINREIRKGNLVRIKNKSVISSESQADNAIDYTDNAFVEGPGNSSTTSTNSSKPQKTNPVNTQDQTQMYDSSAQDSMFESDERAKAWNDLQAENAVLEETVTQLKKEVDKLTKKAAQLGRTDKPEIRLNDARKMARQIIKDTRPEPITTRDKADIREQTKKLAESIKEVGDYILETGRNPNEMDYSELRSMAQSIAQDIVNNAEAEIDDGGFTKTMRDQMRAALKNRAIFVPENVRADTLDWNDFKKRYRGVFTFKDTGTDIDIVYKSLLEEIPGLLDPNINNPGDMLNELAEKWDLLQPKYENPFEDYINEATNHYTNMILQGALDGTLREIAPTYADRMNDRIAQIRAEGRERVAATRAEGRAALEELRAEKNARIEEIRQQGIARKQEALAKERADKWERVAATREYYQEMAERAKVRRQNRETRTRIQSLINDLNTRLLHGTETKYVPADLVENTVKILEMIDLDTGRGGVKIQERIAKLQQQYAALKNDPTFAGYAYDPIIEDNITNMAREIGDTPLNKMNSRQLGIVLDTLKQLEHTIRTAVKDKLYGEEWDFFESAKKATKATNAVSAVSANALGKAANWYLTNTMRPDVVFERFGGHAKDSEWTKIADMLNEAQRYGMDLQMRFSKPFEELLKDKKNLEKMTSSKEGDLLDIGLKDENGKAIKITRDFMLFVYMNLQNEDNIQHIMRGGITVPELKEYLSGKGDRGFGVGARRAVGVSQRLSDINKAINESTDANEKARLLQEKEDVLKEGMEYISNLRENIEKKLNDYDRKWIKAWWEFNALASEALNETTMQVYGIKKFRVENYFPIITDRNFLNVPMETIIKDMSLENAGFTKERIHASNPIKMMGLADVINMQANRTAQYAAIMPATRAFNKIFNKTMPGYTTSVKEALNSKFGGESIKFIENLMADLQGGRRGDFNIFDRLRGRMAQATLSLNPRVALAQTASFPTAAAELGWKPIMKALAKGGKNNMMISAADRELIAKWSSALWYRSKGATVDLADVKNLQQTQHKVMDKLGWAMNWINFMDSATVGRLWYAAQYYVDDNFKALKKGSDAYYEKVAEAFNRCIERTQPNYTTMQRPELLRNPHAIIRQLSMFMTQRLQNQSIMYGATAKYLKYRADLASGKNGVTQADVNEMGKRAVWAATSQIAATATITVFKFLCDALLHRLNGYRRKEDKTLDAESISLAMLDNFSESLISNMFLGSELYSVVKSIITKETYYGIELSGVSTLTGTIENIVKFGQKPSWSMAKKLGESLALYLGIPAENAEKIGQAVWYWMQDGMNGELFSFEAGVERTDAMNAKLLTEAYTSGDQKAIEKYSATYEDDDDMLDAVRSYVKTGYVSKDKQTISKTEAVDLLIKSGMRKADAEAKVQEWTCELVTGIPFSKIKDEFMAGNITQARVSELLQKYGGRTKENANRTARSYACEKETGHPYNDLKEAYVLGEISRTVLEKAMRKYGGMSSEDTDKKLVYYDFLKENPNSDMAENRAYAYMTKLKPVGITAKDFEDIMNKADSDKNGSYTQNEIGSWLDAKGYSKKQADALWSTMGPTWKIGYDAWQVKFNADMAASGTGSKNGYVSQRELGPYLVKQINSGKMTMDQAKEYWKVFFSKSSTTFTRWLKKNHYKIS